MSAETRDRLYSEAIGFGRAFTDRLTFAALGKTQPTEDRQRMLIGAWAAFEGLRDRMAKLEPFMPKTAAEGCGLANDLREVERR